ncbi:MAG: M23 family metallopeptidase [candidate division KSB1 bacterium]|nr:M23 family metallopeptidase [candidate division KSB1 bacterium]MDZ7341098.1 M23 family metallopeptidase [candidate division KSB1 bacterium]
MRNSIKVIFSFLILLLLAVVLYQHLFPPSETPHQPQPSSIAPASPTAESVTKVGVIRSGETLSSLLLASGIPQRQMQAIIESFKKMYSVHQLKPGDKYEIATDSIGNFISLAYSPSVEKKYWLIADSTGQHQTLQEQAELVTKIKYLSGSIQTTLYDAIIESGETPELLLLFTDIFQWDVDFFIDPRIGDQFKIVYEKTYLANQDQFIRYGKILAAQYLRIGGDTLTAILFDNQPQGRGYYDLLGKSFQKTFLKSPLNYRRISSHFSYSRRHPILKIARPHYGVDYAAPAGTPVSAAADGIVIDRGYDKGIGNFVKVQHKNGRFVTLYGHLSRFHPGIAKGVRVSQKDIIGYVGSTGLATGPHLHYTFYDNGRPIDPLKIKNVAGEPISAANLSRFQAMRDSLLSELAGIEGRNIPLTLLTSQQVHYNRYSILEK